jgi:SUN domain-containing protein 1/2
MPQPGVRTADSTLSSQGPSHEEYEEYDPQPETSRQGASMNNSYRKRAKSPTEHMAELSRRLSPAREYRRGASPQEEEHYYQPLVVPDAIYTHHGDRDQSISVALDQDSYSYEEEERDVAAQDHYDRSRSAQPYVISGEPAEDVFGGSSPTEQRMAMLKSAHKAGPSSSKLFAPAKVVPAAPSVKSRAHSSREWDSPPPSRQAQEQEHYDDEEEDENWEPVKYPSVYEKNKEDRSREWQKERSYRSPGAYPDKEEPPPFSLGATLGVAVYHLFRVGSALTMSTVRLSAIFAIISASMFTFIHELLIVRPLSIIQLISQMISPNLPRFNPSLLIQSLLLSIILVVGFRMLTDSTVQPDHSGHSRAPDRHAGFPSRLPNDLPTGAVRDLVTRLSDLEELFSDLSSAHHKISTDSSASDTLSSHIVSLENKIQSEASRAADAEMRFHNAALKAVQVLQSRLDDVSEETASLRSQTSRSGSDRKKTLSEMDGTVRHLKDKMGTIESSMKDALVQVQKYMQSRGNEGESCSDGSKSMSVRGPTGEDLNSIIHSLVDSAVSRSEQALTIPDFALYSSGGRIIRSMTSRTYKGRPDRWLRTLTRKNSPKFKPPVTALVPDIHVGNCWAFAGAKGRLGIALSRKVYISAVTVDHPRKEAVFETGTAPREFKVWGLLYGEENVAKAAAYIKTSSPGRSSSEAPSDYLHIASFSYNVNSELSTQTFSIFGAVRDLGISFDTVVFEIESNWGSEEYTCLYRVRVHGEIALSS